jgi:hypothetical protein
MMIVPNLQAPTITMSPSPLAPINEEGSWAPLKDDKNSSSSCNVSVATSSSGVIDDPDYNFDPNSVDFEPLLVSGTGKILSYHTDDHIEYYHSGSYDEEDESSTVDTSRTSASLETRVVENSDRGGRRRRRRRENNTNNRVASWTYPQMVRIASVLSMVTFVSIHLLSRPLISRSSSSYQMQKTVAKAKPTHVASVVTDRPASEAAAGALYASNQPLFEAVKSNNIDLTRMLLDGVSRTAQETNNNYDINCEDPQGMTPLIEATLIGNIDLVKLLLNHGARAQPIPGFLHTPLRAACLTSNLDLIRLLLDEGADPNAQSDGGRTPLMGACYLRPQFDDLPNREEVSFSAVQLMLSDPRTRPEIRNSFGESALDLCQGRKYDKSTKLLRRAIYERGEKRRESKQSQG